MKLPDGRILGYAEAGDLKGRPLFLFHGLNSSRLEVNIVHEQMLKSGIRVIGVDRAGMGLSTFQEDRRIVDFVDDITYLADRLQVDHFSVMGVSAGTPYALACAYKIPHRILSCGIISGIAPVFEFGTEHMLKENRIFIFLAQKLPWFVRPLFWLLEGRFSQDDAKADQFLESIFNTLDDVDKKLIKNTKARKMLLNTFRESYKQGSKGVACDGILAFGKPWGFSLEEINLSPIFFWHGEKDLAIPVSMAKTMAKKISGATFKVYPNKGHLSIIFDRIDDIIDDLLRGYEQK
ncbi:MAG: hypothetical protein P794_05865 [Epsilonproteobacteria bacterium (ex Lamellibrachia satsuma)]|nr:MAG: hypothetical protein P794_05865 [Epsilonproteobacteria bacterium (ex Lamellibrachia satsuma)]